MRKTLTGLIAVMICLFFYVFTEVSAEWTVLELYYDGHEHLYYAEPINLYINGVRIEMFGTDMPPIILEDRVYVPVRDVFEMLGATVTWSSELEQVLIRYGAQLVALRGGSPYINIDGILHELPVPAKNINGRTMAPVAFIADIFGFTADWFGESRTIIIDSGEPLPTPTPPIVADPPDGGDIYVHIEDPYDDNLTALDVNVGTGPVHLERSIDADPEPLPVADHPKTELIGIDFADNNPHAFYIQAAGPLTKVEKFLLPDNRLVLDIYNCEKLMPETELPVEGSLLIQKVRAGQNQVQPEMITRVVFDLLEPVSFSVALSEGRETIIVSLLRNEITGVEFSSDGYSDFIYIHGRLTPVVNIFPQTVEGVLIVDVPLGVVNSPINMPVNGVFAQGVRTTQFNPGMARVSIDMKDTAAYDVTYNGNTTVIRLIRPTYQNLVYDSFTSRLTIPKSPYLDLDIDRIVLSDEYLNFEYAFILPGDFSGFFGEGNYIIRDRYINHIAVSTVNGCTSIRFFQQRVMAYTIWEDQDNIYIQAMLPRDKYSRIVVIDPGHGGNHPGTIANGLVEKELNLDIALRLVRLLENSGVKTYMTRIGDTNPTLEQRARFANEVGDLFISIHNNGHDSSAVHGTETYFWPHENDDTIGISSEDASDIMLRSIVATIGIHNRGSKEHPYRVLTNTLIPAVLVEFAFLTNAADAARLKTDEFLQRCAEGAFRGIQEIFAEYTPRR
ncbi:MAG: N-acetylmuramoyl-L-alanine amidase family protein [Defluviitaleaceae bacterium]|nr:N-acetylmuramoyl-L-alanine amidase family protein [Defluviitaleaceae bacterium]MCL2836802.1 N-acetylmuramoyl-L-alanine amidase family protein [Defluviitaleaceae bacterium]